MAKETVKDKMLWIQSLITVIASCFIATALNGALSASGATLAPPPHPTSVSGSVAPSSPSEGV